MQAMTVILLRVRVPVLSEQMWVALPMVSEEASFRTRLFSFLILALEKLREIVTARGSPSGMATTTTVMAMMTDSSRDLYSLKSFSTPSTSLSKLKLRGVQPSSSSQVRMLAQPQGRTLVYSRVILITWAAMVRQATKMPTFPILLAMVSSFSWRRVGWGACWVLVVITPATVLGPTARTRAFPKPVATSDLAIIVHILPSL
mmetsp:Transcript_15972/g.26936  ORF Transcript_15972/g.26936 Transcript_15972/m.26936 type:complete len:202 (+) Transcript_15972:2344-2949(+)